MERRYVPRYIRKREIYKERAYTKRKRTYMKEGRFTQSRNVYGEGTYTKRVHIQMGTYTDREHM